MPKLKRTVNKVGSNTTTDVFVDRIISQIGDSTDGEDYELPEGTSQSKKHNIVAKMNQYKYKHQYKYRDPNTSKLADGFTEVDVSCILKEMGTQLLQSEEVRIKYKDIKSKFISINQAKYENLDEILGRGWDLIVNYYDLSKNKMLEVAASNYFKMNREKIQKSCNNDVDYQNLNNDAEKGEYYLKQKVGIQNRFKEIYKLNKELNIQKQREVTEYLSNVSNQEDASLFLAKIKASKKLDKDLGKNHLYDFKHGTGRIISNTSITKKTTQQNETLEICKGGAFKHFKTNEGTYNTIGQELKKLIEGKFINGKKLKEFFQSYLKGKECSAIILKNTATTDLIDQLKTDIELIFGIEVKRNPAALLTNAIFFDLVDSGLYKIEHIASKMPMAMEGAVLASVIIDTQIDKLTYDYRGMPKGYREVQELAKRDQEILQEWLKLKLDISKKVESSNVNNKIPSLGINDLVKKLADMKLDHIDTSKCNTKKKIENEENIGFNFDDCKGTLRLEWNITSGKYEVKVCQIQEVSAKIFYNLIKEWYGIKLSCLNKDDKVILKAAAEPEDPKEDHDYQDDFKVSAIDERKEGPETAESFEYNMQDNTENSIFIQQYHPELIGAVS